MNTGQDRAGARAGQEAVELAVAIASLPGLHLTGVMTHEGHAGFSAPDEIATIAENAGQALVDTAERIRSQGIAVTEVSVGSTPAWWFTPRVAGITEMRPGPTSSMTTMRSGTAASVPIAARHGCSPPSSAVRHPDRAIIDAGSKALALDPSPSHPGHGYIVGHPGATIARLSEEHGVVALSAGETGFDVGDRVEIIPNHVCPAVNLTDELVMVRDGHVVDRWPVAARGKGADRPPTTQPVSSRARGISSFSLPPIGYRNSSGILPVRPKFLKSRTMPSKTTVAAVADLGPR